MIIMFFEDFKMGTQIEIPEAVIEKKDMIEFALKYDNIPLHTDENYAKTTPFGKLIAPGVMSLMSVWAKYLEVDIMGNEFIAGNRSQTEWLKPVYAEDKLYGKAVITNLFKRNDKNGIVELTINICNQNGDLVIINRTQAVVKSRP